MKLFFGKKTLRKNVKKPVSGVGGDFYYVNGTCTKRSASSCFISAIIILTHSTYPFTNRNQCCSGTKLRFGQANAALACRHCTKQGMHRVFQHCSIHIHRLSYTEPYVCLGLRRHALLQAIWDLCSWNIQLGHVCHLVQRSQQPQKYCQPWCWYC